MATVERGGWQRHTTGVGYKLMKKWGYKGSGGIGLNEDGRAAPVLPFNNPGTTGLSSTVISQQAKNNEEPPRQTFYVPKQRTRNRPLQQEENYDFEPVHYLSCVPGNGERARTTSTPNREPEPQFSTEELSQIDDFSNRIKTLVDSEYERLDTLVDVNKTHELKTTFTACPINNNHPDLSERIQTLLNISNDGPDKFKALGDVLQALQRFIPTQGSEKQGERVSFKTLSHCFTIFLHMFDDYAKLQLKELATIWAFPIMCIEVFSWQYDDIKGIKSASFRRRIEKHVDKFYVWKDFMKNQMSFRTHRLWSAISGIIQEDIRRFVWCDWRADFQNVEAINIKCFYLVKAWFKPLHLDNVIINTIVPTLESHAEVWDGKNKVVLDRMMPWSVFLGNDMEQVSLALCVKLIPMLREEWKADDISVLPVIDMLSHTSRLIARRLLEEVLLPKLLAWLSDNFVMNPHNQDLHVFEVFIAWKGVIGSTYMAKMLETFFFPKWHTGLENWLKASPDFEEVLRWYTGWKRVLTLCDVDYELRVVWHFNHALKAMHLSPAVAEILQS